MTRKNIRNWLVILLSFVAIVVMVLFWKIILIILSVALGLLLAVSIVYVIYRFRITCPHCGEEWRNSKEKSGSSEVPRCPSCGKTRKGK